jgi:hypothetical protein
MSEWKDTQSDIRHGAMVGYRLPVTHSLFAHILILRFCAFVVAAALSLLYRYYPSTIILKTKGYSITALLQ